VTVEDDSPRLGSPIALFSGRDYNGRTGMGAWPVDDGNALLVVSNVGDESSSVPRLIVVENVLRDIRQ
jgi:hypothetical protein